MLIYTIYGLELVQVTFTVNNIMRRNDIE